MLTRQNYNIIAALIVQAREFHPSREAEDALDSLTNMLAGAFSVDNPNFSVEKFRYAAGYNRYEHIN